MYTGRIETCGQRIIKALALRKMKQAELCKLAEIPKSSLSLYISDAYDPKQDRLYIMAKVLNVDPVWLMGYDVPMEREKKPTDNDRLSENIKALVEFAKTVPEDKVDLVLKVMKSIVEDN